MVLRSRNARGLRTPYVLADPPCGHREGLTCASQMEINLKIVQLVVFKVNALAANILTILNAPLVSVGAVKEMSVKGGSRSHLVLRLVVRPLPRSLRPSLPFVPYFLFSSFFPTSQSLFPSSSLLSLPPSRTSLCIRGYLP